VNVAILQDGGGASPVLAPITVDGNYFTVDGQLWYWLGLTAFLLRKRFLTGRQAEACAYMDWAAAIGVTILREFSQVDWDGTTKGVEAGFLAADFPNYDDRSHEMYEAAAARGLYIESVAHTFAYNIDAMLAHSVRVDNIAAAHPNAVVEDANEPPVNRIPIDEIVWRFTPRTLAASGQYDPSPYPGRRWGNDHPPRDAEFARKFKGGWEVQTGEGPFAPFQPPWPHPWVLDEPKRIDEGGTEDEWRSLGAGARFFDAGITIHGGVWAQTCTIPTDLVVLGRIAAQLDGVRTVPNQRYYGYAHPADQGSLRRYRRQGADGKTYELSVCPFGFWEV
jgi:hypothetical protein